jgi:hypothetical protein
LKFQTKTSFLAIFFQSLFKVGAVPFPFAAGTGGGGLFAISGGGFSPDSEDEKLELELSELAELDEELPASGASGEGAAALGGSGAALPVDDGAEGAGGVCAFSGGAGAVSLPLAAGAGGEGGAIAGAVSFPFTAGGELGDDGGAGFVSFPASFGAVPFNTAGGRAVGFDPLGEVPFKAAAGLG